MTDNRNRPFPQRQVHLDFHTSALIPGIGSGFDPDEFADTVAAAHVNSITVFAVCHHGLAYYPAKAVPVHPHLKLDLLGHQIEALHKRDIRCPIYITVGWNYHQYNAHPEWRMLDRHGNTYQGAGAGFNGFMQWLHPEYEQQIQAVVYELFDLYGAEVDGLFFDIVFVPWWDGGPFDAVSTAIRKQQGWMEPTVENGARLEHHLRSVFARRMNKVIRARKKDASIFYNNFHPFRTDPAVGLRGEMAYQTQMEMESLPSGFWGYYHFPRFARHTQNLGVPGLGMTGKFHKSWGDFGGRKNRAALEYECFRSQGLGFGNSIGDQLHPTGTICKSTYQLIGQVYAQTEAAEPFYAGTAASPQIGVFCPGALGLPHEQTSKSEEGVFSILEELHYESQMLDAQSDLSGFDGLILPDSVMLDAALAKRINGYLKKGGKILLSGNSGLDRDGHFLLEDLPFDYHGPEELHPTFWRYPEHVAGDGREPMDEAYYDAGYNWKAGKGAKAVVKRVLPYFNRDAGHFCSHFHTPPEKASKHHAVLRSENAFLFADPVFRTYRQYGMSIIRLAVKHALEELIGSPAFGAGLPGTVWLSVRRKGRDAHLTLLHYIPVRKALEIDIIDDTQPLAGLTLEMRLARKPGRVTVFPTGAVLPVSEAGGGVYRVVMPDGARGRLLLTVEGAL